MHSTRHNFRQRIKSVYFRTRYDVFDQAFARVNNPVQISLKRTNTHRLFCRYAQYGNVSPKIDVYAFGVVLYELISAKEAIVKTNAVVTESKGLVALVVYRSLTNTT